MEEGDTTHIVKTLGEGEEKNVTFEGEQYTSNPAPVLSSHNHPSIDTQNYEVIHEPEPQIIEESGNNGSNGGSLVVVEEESVPPVYVNPTPPVPQLTETPPPIRDQTSPSRPSSRASDVQTSLIQVQLQIDASMDNDELEAVRQTMTFVLSFYRKWHEEHYHRNKSSFEFGRAKSIFEVPKTDECLPEFHARVEGVATLYASRLAQTAIQMESSLLAKAAAAFQKVWGAISEDRSETDVWLAFRDEAENMFKAGESWEKLVVVLLLAYLVCLCEDVRPKQRATGFLRSLIQYLVSERRVRWVARHGGWANADWGLRRQRLAKCLCAKSTMYGFVLITIGIAVAGIFFAKKHR